MDLLFFLLAYLVFSIWLVIRIAGTSFALAVATFFFQPVAIVPLVQNWGHPRDDIRLPFVMTLIAWLGLWISAYGILEDANMVYDAGFDDYAYEPLDGMELAILRRNLVSSLELQRGQVELAPLPATLDVPERFRFVDRDGLESLAQAFGLYSLDDTVGMVVHESVDLIDDESPWVIWVSWYPTAHIDWGEPDGIGLEFLEALTASQASEFSARDEDDGFEPWEFEHFAVAPQFDPQRRLITWAEAVRYRHSGDELLDCYAAHVGRRGYMLFAASDMGRQDEELCFRAVRLAASRLRYNEDHAYEDAGFFDADSAFELKDIVTGLAQNGEPGGR